VPPPVPFANAIAAAATPDRATDRNEPLWCVCRRVLKMSTMREALPSDVRPPAKKMAGGRKADARAVRGTERLKWGGGGGEDAWRNAWDWDGRRRRRNENRMGMEGVCAFIMTHCMNIA
jgi:hypothetical protein